MMTDQQVERCLELKAKGFGRWDEQDIADVADLTWEFPNILVLITG